MTTATRPLAYFMARVTVTPTGCWLWQRGRSTKGYGLVTLGGRTVRAHRIAYESLVGPIPEGLVIDHLCRAPACVNPAHMEPVTNAENILRGKSPAAQHARKTHCKRGHKLPPLRPRKRGARASAQRRCNVCRALLKRQSKGVAETT